MKNILLLSIYILTISINLVAQSSKHSVIQEDFTIGHDFNGKEISAKKYIFPERINNFYFDATDNNFTVLTRGVKKNMYLKDKGYTFRFDPVENTIKWSKKISYDYPINVINDLIITTNGSRVFCNNLKNKDFLWSIPFIDLYHIDYNKNIGLGFMPKGENTLTCIDFNNGKILWEFDMKNMQIWEKTFYLNDTSLLITASGLHKINPLTGTGWSYDAVTSKKDHTNAIAVGAAGIAMGLLTGFYTIPTGSDLVHDLASNVAVDTDNSLYFASKENIVKINSNTGDIIWETSLPDDLTSSSKIYIGDSLIYLVNNGLAYFNNRKTFWGIPFIAAYNKNSGKQQFFYTIKQDDAYIIYSEITDSCLKIVSKDRISRYSLENGKEIYSVKYDYNTYGNILFQLNDNTYQKENDNLFSNLKLSDVTNNYFVTNKNLIVILDKNFNYINDIKFEELYLYHNDINNDYKIISQGNKSFIINSNNEKIAEININKNIYISNNKLYGVDGNSIIEVDLSKIINSDD